MAMENSLDVYTQPEDPKRPLVCRDECPKQLLGETRTPLAAELGNPVRFDTEYVRNGTCELFMFAAPLTRWRSAEVTEHRKRADGVEQIKRLVDEDFSDQENGIYAVSNMRYVAALAVRKYLPEQPHDTGASVLAGR
jgi:hypothetical protein